MDKNEAARLVRMALGPKENVAFPDIVNFNEAGWALIQLAAEGEDIRPLLEKPTT